jgi:hypothetical protein
MLAYRDWSSDVCSSDLLGTITGEVNFLPFLPWLTLRGWRGIKLEAKYSDSLSVNTPDELEAWKKSVNE